MNLLLLKRHFKTLGNNLITYINKYGAYTLIWLFAIGFIFVILQDLSRPGYVMQDVGIVTKSGCVTSKYKSKNIYDCSADIEFLHAGPQRMVLKFGVLSDDEIMIVCKDEYYFLHAICKTVRSDDKYLVK